MNTEVLVPAARAFVAELDAAYPRRGRESDGSIASREHTAGNPTSDHEPGPPGSPSPDKVDAVDIDADLVPGDRAASERAMYSDVLPAFQAHPGTQYWIFQDRIAHRDELWVPRSYAYAGPGRNRHTKHAHLNWRETKAAHTDVSLYGLRGVGMEPADVWSYDPGIDAKGNARRGGIPNPRPDEKAANPTIGPNTALYRAAAGYDLTLAMTRTLKTLMATAGTLNDAARARIVADVLTVLRRELPDIMRAVLAELRDTP